MACVQQRAWLPLMCLAVAAAAGSVTDAAANKASAPAKKLDGRAKQAALRREAAEGSKIRLETPQLTKKQMIPAGRFLGLVALHGVTCAPSFLPPADRARLLLPMWQSLDDLAVPGTDFLPYFRQRLFTEDAGRPVSAYVNRQGDRFLVVVANQTDQRAALTLTYHPDAHRLADGIDSAVETFSQRTVPCRQNRLSVELGAWEFEMLDVRLQGRPPGMKSTDLQSDLGRDVQ